MRAKSAQLSVLCPCVVLPRQQPEKLLLPRCLIAKAEQVTDVVTGRALICQLANSSVSMACPHRQRVQERCPFCAIPLQKSWNACSRL